MKTVIRHSLTVRLTHWLVAMSGIVLLFSGFGQMPMYKRYNIIKIPGLSWSSNYEITLQIHYISAAIFTAAVCFHLMYHFRRKEFGILPRKGDIGQSILGFLSMFGMAKEPEHGKFQAKQRVIYAIFGAAIGILIVTGLIKSYKNLGTITLEPMLLQIVAFTHTITGMLFMMLFLAHVAALLLYRPLIPSMFTGRIDREYVSKHHSEWKHD